MNRIRVLTEVTSCTNYELYTRNIVIFEAVTNLDSNTSQCVFIKFQIAAGS